jgi:wyosine [tRNA(Phe)-imidazoG37] synthetase (radical SAM superfamily)
MMDFEKAKEFPAIINVNVMAGQCPCRCVHCPVGQIAPVDRAAHFRARSMDLSLFARIADEVSRHKDSLLRLHSVGEPLLWDALPGALDILSARWVKSWLFTCAVTQDTSLLEKLCDSVSIIEVSVNASSRRDYKQTKGIDAFDLVSENIQWMSEYIKVKKLPTRLLLSRVESPDAKQDNRFLSYWKEKRVAADVFVRSYHNYNNMLDIRRENGTKKPCLVHWARASIDCGGEMVCCFNELFKPYTNDVVLGKLDQSTNIFDIWKGEKLAAIRSCDESGRFECLGFDIPCKTCQTCQPIDTHRETSEKQLAALG